MTDDEHTVLRATVFTPTPRLTITVEPEPGGDEIHLHAGPAGALNVTRRGLASGERASIERLADQIEVIPLDDSRRQHPRPAP